VNVCYWPDGVWCEQSEVYGMGHRSDDYGVLELPDENAYEDWQVDMMVGALVSGRI